MKNLCVLAVLAFIIIPTPARAQTAKEVIEKAIEAHGGMDNLKKYPAATAKMKGTISIMNLELPIEGESAYFLPDMGKNVMKMNFGGQNIAIEQIINNGKIKMSANGMAVPVSEALKKEMLDSVRMQTMGLLYPLLDEKTYELSLIKNPEKINDKEVVGVLVKAKGQADTKWYFDAKTFVEQAMERKGLDPAEQEVDQKIVCLEFKKIDGILRATKCEMYNDGKKFMTFTISDVKHAEKLDKKLFDIAD